MKLDFWKNKKNRNPNLHSVGLNEAQNEGFFCHFLESTSLVFLEVAYNDNIIAAVSNI